MKVKLLIIRSDMKEGKYLPRVELWGLNINVGTFFCNELIQSSDNYYFFFCYLKKKKKNDTERISKN